MHNDCNDWHIYMKLESLSSLCSEGGKRITSKEEIHAIQWATWTSVLGSEVNGIWPKYSQVNDVNATDALFAHRVIATGDDFGLVKLFRFPSIRKGMNEMEVLRGALAWL